MKQRMFLLLQYLLLLAGILGSVFLIHKNTLKGRTILLSGKEIEAIAIDSKDRVWVATTWDGVVIFDGMKTTSFDSIGESTWITMIGVDESDQVWVIAGTGVLAAYSPATIYKFNGSDWVAQGQTTGRPNKDQIPCCLPSDEMIVRDVQFEEYSAFLEIANQISIFDKQRFLRDKQGNMWAGTDSGLVHFSSDFKIPPPPLKALHIFLSSGGYWFLGVIITIVFYETSEKWAHARQLKKWAHAKQLKFLPAIIFSLFSLVSIMAGWLIGTSGGLGLISPGDYVAEGGIRGGLLGLILGSFLSFGSFGLVTGWIWRKRYSNLRLKQSLLLVLGWMLIPAFILLLMFWSYDF